MRVLLLADKKKSSQTSEVWKLEEILGISLYTVLREHLPQKKRFISGIARKRGGGGPCPNFLTLFLEASVGLLMEMGVKHIVDRVEGGVVENSEEVLGLESPCFLRA